MVGNLNSPIFGGGLYHTALILLAFSADMKRGTFLFLPVPPMVQVDFDRGSSGKPGALCGELGDLEYFKEGDDLTLLMLGSER